MIEFIDHTADVGIRVRAKTLKELFREAAYGLLNIMFSFERDSFPLEEEVLVEIYAEDPEELLITWLNELIYLFESKGYAFRNIEIMEISDTSLKAKVECFRVKKGEVISYVKSATYHGLSLRRMPDGFYEATVIFDI